jgi:flavodoxin
MSYESEVLAVKALGDQIGYGNMMNIASALWRDMLEKSGAPKQGAHIPTIMACIKEEEKEWIQKELDRTDERIQPIIKNAST